MNTLTSISRRDLLKAGGALVVCFSWESLLPEFGAAQTVANPSPARPLDPADVDSFFAIHADGAITRVELHPKIIYGGARQPTPADLEWLHDKAHRECFIANSVTTEVRVVQVD